MDPTINHPAIPIPTKPHVRKWLIIGTTAHPKMGFTDRQIIKTLQDIKVEVFYVDPTTMAHDIPSIIADNQLDMIYWEAINGWGVWDIIKKVPCAKVNTWFDDPIMRIDSVDIAKKMSSATVPNDPQFTNKPNDQMGKTRIYCWDDYWNIRLLTDYSIDSDLVHLAANPNEYYTTDVVCESKPVFIGALHSNRKFEEMKSRLCEPFITILDSIKESLKTMDQIPSWDRIEGHYLNILSPGTQRLYRQLCETDKRMQSWYRQGIWAISKNEVRVRMLRAALKVSPISMFADTKGVNHANEGEIRSLIGDGEERLTFYDTTGISQEHLAMFYHYGWIHLQATDPQSVTQGYSYRVFQTMAAGKCLLTDLKANMSKDFEMDKVMVGYNNLEEMKEKLNNLIKNKSLSKDIGENARHDFEQNHTWEKRLDQWMI